MKIKAGVLVASDRCFHKDREDQSGALICKLAVEKNWEVEACVILPDEKNLIANELVRLSDMVQCDVVFTSGGTGLSERDVTPEATESIVDRMVPGISELIRKETLKFTKHAALSRAVSGIRKKTLIINLPGNPHGVRQAFHVVFDLIEHAVGLIRGEREHLNHINRAIC